MPVFNLRSVRLARGAAGLFLAAAALVFGWRLASAPAAAAAGDELIYAETLSGSWADWSWNTSRDFANAAPVQAGAASVRVTYSAAWGGLYLHAAAPLSGGDYDRLRFWLHGGAAGGQKVSVSLYTAAGQATPAVAITPTAGVWTLVEIPLSQFGSPASVQGVVWQDASGGSQPAYYLDEISLVGRASSGAGILLTVDALSRTRSISPDIYGFHYYTTLTLSQELDLTVQRWGGNDTTRYNWKINASNSGNDWYFQNNAMGQSADAWITTGRAAGLDSILTLPLAGYVAKDARSCGFDTRTYAYTPAAADPADPTRWYCGNGVRAGSGQLVTGNNPLDTSLPITAAFNAEWVAHLVATHGLAQAGGVRYYSLDNEPGIWDGTHRDIHPAPISYTEILSRGIAAAQIVKALDPGAQVLGPVQDGWTRYWYAAYVNQTQADADRNVNGGGLAFLPWYLQQMKAYEQAHGLRLLDYLDVHYYPQAEGVALAPAGVITTQVKRLNSTRSLWDPTYVDQSWIGSAGPDGGVVRLLPRLREWIAAYYPGTRLAITEYNWGATDDLNGALAQADVLGLFGREGVDLALFFNSGFGGSPFAVDQPVVQAFRMYRNYDGQGGRFGDASLAAASADPGQLAVYAAARAGDSALTLMVINKTAGVLTGTVALSGFSPGAAARVYRYSAANLAAIQRAPDQPLTGAGFSAAFPAYSITLVAAPAAAARRYYLYLPQVKR